MKNPFESMCAKATPTQVMEAASNATQFELDTAAAELTDEEFHKIGMWTSEKLTVGGVQAVLACGCLLYLYSIATEAKSLREMFSSMLSDVGIKETQAYRNIAVWNSFGEVLTKEQFLMSMFTAEALKILAEERTPQPARETAIECARNGERITIKRAREFQVEYGVVLDSPKPIEATAKVEAAPKAAKETQKLKPAKALWSFVGKSVRLVVQAAKRSSKADLNAMILDLEAALEELRRKATNENLSEPSDAA